MRHRRNWLVLIAATALLASCGGGDEQASSTTINGTGPKTSAEPSQSDIYFGALDVRQAGDGTGLFVRGYERASPIATAGIQHGDVIAAVDGSRVRNVPDMIEALNGLPAEHDAADVVRVEVLRASEPQTLKVTLAANVYLGTAVQEATGGRNGVLVVSVKDPAAAAGIRRGDLITAVEGKTVKTVDGLFAVLGTHQPGDRVAVTISRGSDVRRVSLILAPRPRVR